MVSSPWSHGRGHHNDVYCDPECCYSDEPEHLHLGVGAGLGGWPAAGRSDRPR